jgi:hypothetical protein
MKRPLWDSLSCDDFEMRWVRALSSGAGPTLMREFVGINIIRSTKLKAVQGT